MKKKVAILYADGFEDTEALATRDILVRAGLDIYDLYVENVNNSNYVLASHGVKLTGFKSSLGYKGDEFDAIILPGGGLGVKNLLESKEVERILLEGHKANKLLCAICAGPMVLGKYGYLHNKKYTCFKGCNEGLDGLFTASEVEVDKGLITARAMLYSIPFGLKIVEYLLGIEIATKVGNQIKGI